MASKLEKAPLKEGSKVPTKRLAFKARDVTRAMKAAQAAKFDTAAVEIDPCTGKIRIIGKTAANQANDLDRELEEFDARHG
jgi:hypothetical protein